MPTNNSDRASAGSLNGAKFWANPRRIWLIEHPLVQASGGVELVHFHGRQQIDGKGVEHLAAPRKEADHVEFLRSLLTLITLAIATASFVI